ncbi:hypothetical protein MRB53_040137 [Persea americana]|nr:hypothetical protein MRB53_040137 [Persea americana]
MLPTNFKTPYAPPGRLTVSPTCASPDSVSIDKASALDWARELRTSACTSTLLLVRSLTALKQTDTIVDNDRDMYKGFSNRSELAAEEIARNIDLFIVQAGADDQCTIALVVHDSLLA